MSKFCIDDMVKEPVKVKDLIVCVPATCKIYWHLSVPTRYTSASECAYFRADLCYVKYSNLKNLRVI